MGVLNIALKIKMSLGTFHSFYSMFILLFLFSTLLSSPGPCKNKQTRVQTKPQGTSLCGTECAQVCFWTSLVVQMVKNLLAMWETWVRSLGWEDPLE